VLGISLIFFSLLMLIGAYSYSLVQKRNQSIPAKLAQSVILPPKMDSSLTIDKTIFSDEQIQILSYAVTRLNVPWNSLFVALESIQSPNVAITGILPNQKKQQLEVTGEARNVQAMLGYVESLEDLAMLEHVTLQKHQVNETHSYRPVRFVILAEWR
jgi:hypothetical protein